MSIERHTVAGSFGCPASAGSVQRRGRQSAPTVINRGFLDFRFRGNDVWGMSIIEELWVPEAGLVQFPGGLFSPNPPIVGVRLAN